MSGTKATGDEWGQKGNLLQNCATIPNQNTDLRLSHVRANVHLYLASEDKKLEKVA